MARRTGVSRDRAGAARTALAQIIDGELDRAVPEAVAAFASLLAERGGPGVAGVLFYGSALRDDALDGVLDFYVLTDRSGDWPGSALAAMAGRLLPPNVGYLERSLAVGPAKRTVRAKFAVMTLAQFARGTSAASMDTTLWARFSQPCVRVHCRSDADASAIRDAVVQAVVTASRWAAMLGPPSGTAADYWRALYKATYSIELRVEHSSRGVDLVSRHLGRYATSLPLAWDVAGVASCVSHPGAGHGGAQRADGGSIATTLEPSISPQSRRRALRQWALRARLGKPLNLLRLMKAALTFDNAVDYVAWKIERHSGYRIDPTPFQRRHPLLAAPALYWRLRSRKVLR